MNDGIYFADVDLPFHVWVRERSGAKGYRWVLREAPHSRAGGSAGSSASGRERPPTSQGPA
jgi:hypothetical protein